MMILMMLMLEDLPVSLVERGVEKGWRRRRKKGKRDETEVSFVRSSKRT